MKKEKIIRSYQRRTKSGKIVTVRQHTAKYDARGVVVGSLRKESSGEELKGLLDRKDILPFEESEFLDWYEGVGNSADKKVAKILKNHFGSGTYNRLNDLAADTYKKGGGKTFLSENIASKYKFYQKQSQDIKKSILRVISDLQKGVISSYSGMCYEPSVEEVSKFIDRVKRQNKDVSISLRKTSKTGGDPWRSIDISLKGQK